MTVGIKMLIQYELRIRYEIRIGDKGSIAEEERVDKLEGYGILKSAYNKAPTQIRKHVYESNQHCFAGRFYAGEGDRSI